MKAFILAVPPLPLVDRLVGGGGGGTGAEGETGERPPGPHLVSATTAQSTSCLLPALLPGFVAKCAAVAVPQVATGWGLKKRALNTSGFTHHPGGPRRASDLIFHPRLV